MEITVEGPEPYANESYQWLLERVLIDMGMSNLVQKARLIIRPDQTLFIISLKVRKSSGQMPVRQIADLEDRGGGTFIEIKDETYAPRLLSMLWRLYGRERIQQLSRLEIFCEGLYREEISELKLDPEEEVRSKMLDAVWRLLPEGLKIRHEMVTNDVLTIAATEHDMKADFIKEAEKVHKGMGGA